MIDAGEADGITVGAEFEVYRDQNSGDLLGTVVVRELSAFSTTLHAKESRIALEQDGVGLKSRAETDEQVRMSDVPQLPTVPTITMAPESTGESSKHAIERPGHSTNLGEATMRASGLIISLVQEAAALSPCAELKQAAAVALVIFQTIQVYDLIDLCFNDLTVYRQSRLITRHTNDLVTIQLGSSSLFGARIRRQNPQRNGYLQICKRSW